MDREEEEDEDMVTDDRRKEFLTRFAPFERAVLVAWARRTLYTSPDFQPAKALKIRIRWPEVVLKAQMFLEVDK